MEKERKIKTLSLIALIVAVLGLMVAFAALSQTLTINGTANVNSAEWNVHFDENIESYAFGNAKIVIPPTIQNNSLHVGNFEVVLTKPGDGVRFDFTVINGGTIMAKHDQNAKINGVIITGLSSDEDAANILFEEADYDGDGTTTTEEKVKALQNIYFDYKFEGFNTDSYDNYTLAPGKSGKIIYKIGFDQAATELPKGNVKLNMNMEFIFEQM